MLDEVTFSLHLLKPISFFCLQSKVLELGVYDHDFAGKDDFMGRANIDLSKYKSKRSHNVQQLLD